MNAVEQFEALGIEPEHCGRLALALEVLSTVPADQLRRAVETIDRSMAFGPFTDPTFFVRTPAAFEIGRRNSALFEAILALKQHLPEKELG